MTKKLLLNLNPTSDDVISELARWTGNTKTRTINLLLEFALANICGDEELLKRWMTHAKKFNANKLGDNTNLGFNLVKTVYNQIFTNP